MITPNNYINSLNTLYWRTTDQTPLELMIFLRETLKLAENIAGDIELRSDARSEDRTWSHSVADLLHTIGGVALGNIQQLVLKEEENK